MDKLKKILQNAKTGDHPACNSCLRNPKKNNTSFAISCNEHYGMDKNGLIIIARDPGASGGGSSHTEILCPIHNSDNSANRLLSNLSLLNIPNRSIYFLNAILHGFFDKNSKANNNTERKYCRVVLAEIFNCLQPKAILTLGLESLHSTIEILQNSEIKKPTLKEMVQKSFSYGQISGVHIFAMPHPAYASVNLSKHGLNESEVWQDVAKELNKVFC